MNKSQRISFIYHTLNEIYPDPPHPKLVGEPAWREHAAAHVMSKVRQVAPALWQPQVGQQQQQLAYSGGILSGGNVAGHTGHIGQAAPALRFWTIFRLITTEVPSRSAKPQRLNKDLFYLILFSLIKGM